MKTQTNTETAGKVRYHVVRPSRSTTKVGMNHVHPAWPVEAPEYTLFRAGDADMRSAVKRSMDSWLRRSGARTCHWEYIGPQALGTTWFYAYSVTLAAGLRPYADVVVLIEW